MTIRSEFRPQCLNAQGVFKVHEIAEAFSTLLNAVERTVLEGLDASKLPRDDPSGRHLALVRTKLEEAIHHATEAVGRRPENQEAPK